MISFETHIHNTYDSAAIVLWVLFFGSENCHQNADSVKMFLLIMGSLGVNNSENSKKLYFADLAFETGITGPSPVRNFKLPKVS
jgi:hypothetical protein